MNIVGGTDVIRRLVLLDVEAVQSHQGRGLLRIPLVLLHNRGAELLAIYGDDRSEMEHHCRMKISGYQYLGLPWNF